MPPRPSRPMTTKRPMAAPGGGPSPPGAPSGVSLNGAVSVVPSWIERFTSAAAERGTAPACA